MRTDLLRASVFGIFIALAGCETAGTGTGTGSGTGSGAAPQEAHELDGTWTGQWSSGVHGGLAELVLDVDGASADGEMTFHGTGRGTISFSADGRLEGDQLVLRPEGARHTYTVERTDERLRLTGGYELTEGSYSGETGSVYFMKPR